jgi:uncharacterized membrane protein
MPILAIHLYDVVLTVHVVAVVLAFGPTFAYPFMQGLAERSEPRSIPYYARVMRRIDRTFVVPGMLVILAAGLYLVIRGPWTFSAPWVSAGFLIIGILLVLELAVLWPGEAKLIALSERDIAAAGDGEIELSDEYRGVARRFAMAGGFASLLVVIAIALMVLKPGGA